MPPFSVILAWLSSEMLLTDRRVAELGAVAAGASDSDSEVSQGEETCDRGDSPPPSSSSAAPCQDLFNRFIHQILLMLT